MVDRGNEPLGGILVSAFNYRPSLNYFPLIVGRARRNENANRSQFLRGNCGKGQAGNERVSFFLSLFYDGIRRRYR